MQEFVYYNPGGLDFPLDEAIFVAKTIEETKDANFLISNTSEVDSEVSANEIDFYIRNSKDSISDKIKNVYKLYEVAAIKFDNAQDITYTQKVGNKLLLIANKENAKEFISSVKANEFDMYQISEDIIKSITGHIGNLSVIVDDEGKDVTLKVDQIVWFNIKEMGLKQSGSFDPITSSVDEVIKTLRKNIEEYEYKKITTYDANICQYHERREEVCGRCEDVCPTTAIIKIDDRKHLEFSQIDCHGCGGCISICPSGALEYAPISRNSIYEMAQEFRGSIPLIVPDKMNISTLDIELKPNVLPFKIDGEKFLHETSFLTILQESGSQIIFYTDFLSKGSKDAIRILNDIYEKKYGKKAIFVAMNEEELNQAIQNANLIEGSHFSYNQEDERKREAFAVRLSGLVGNDDLGVVKTGENVHYAKVNINQDNCTLCLSCVGACNVDALKAYPEDNTLRLNPSICTGCGYCELSCPEKDCLTIEQDIIELNPKWFLERVVAKDELFACVECGKEFATKKSIEKIASIMGPIFANDPVKQRTLYCCENCKPKVMFANDAVRNQRV
ncbi:4Fe-4S ferredoxin [Malaciobacter molluscorum LMG 25693]|uniref:4Fe-4S ferredoxin n=1 Tax=Malaciobacter molluscorum LMG 25693 TaxID=870501 RepID=A0A2G1DES0_9BACT|nr:4Fe-4S dicluster domain-containing protein [Malaciobacter molluscorum]AXX91962.1 [4Fe-4S] dicluster domain-containing protein [Malaciobacter molluscorum LMG 25693]PHO16836.1 4Fe-4S ferredoxin [Malaciobacter molluscorum LMG 25693]